MSMRRMSQATALMVNIHKKVNASGRAILWRNSVGFDSHANIHYGLGVGSADLVGMLLNGSARWIALEVKSGRGEPTPEQIAYLAVMRSRGAFAAIVRSVHDAMRAIDAAERGLFDLAA